MARDMIKESSFSASFVKSVFGWLFGIIFNDVLQVEARCEDLRRMYALVRPLGPAALRPLVDAADAQVVREGTALLDQPHPRDEVSALLYIHTDATVYC